MRRYLVVANQTLGGEPLLDELRRSLRSGSASFHVVVPATHPKDQWTWTEGEADAIAADRLERALERFRELGATEVTGEVGSPRPIEAMGDALRDGEFDGIVLSTLPAGVSKWLNQDLPSRVERAFDLPVTHVITEAEQVAS